MFFFLLHIFAGYFWHITDLHFDPLYSTKGDVLRSKINIVDWPDVLIFYFLHFFFQNKVVGIQSTIRVLRRYHDLLENLVIICATVHGVYLNRPHKQWKLVKGIMLSLYCGLGKYFDETIPNKKNLICCRWENINECKLGFQIFKFFFFLLFDIKKITLERIFFGYLTKHVKKFHYEYKTEKFWHFCCCCSFELLLEFFFL
jgi:hypothetical protein